MKKITSLVLVLVLLTSCGGAKTELESLDPSQVEDLSPRRVQSLSLPLTNMSSLNPLVTKNPDYFHFSHLVYEGLFYFDSRGAIQPRLADHYEISSDGRRVSITLKDEVYWQDGVKFSSEDVAMTFNGLKNLPNDSPVIAYLRGAVGQTQTFDKENFARALVFDERNLDIEFDRPYAHVLEMLVFPILPAHLYSEEDLSQEENFQVLGTGPYQFKSYRKNSDLVLERNPNYYGPTAYIEEIRGKILESEDRILQAFEAGQLDLALLTDYNWDKLRSKNTVRLEAYDTNDLELMAINQARPHFQGQSGLALRKALASAINKDRLVGSLYLQEASLANFLLNPNNYPGFSGENQVYYSLESSKEILNQAGFSDLDGDGWLEDPQGQTLDLEIKTNLDSYQRRTEAEFIQEDLSNLGIRSRIVEETQDRPMDWDALQEDLETGNFDLAIYGIQFSILPDLAQVLYSRGSLNYASYSSQEMDQALSELALTRERNQRQDLLDDISYIFTEDPVYIPLVFKQNMLARSAKISQNLNPSMFSVYGGLRDAYMTRD